MPSQLTEVVQVVEVQIMPSQLTEVVQVVEAQIMPSPLTVAQTIAAKVTHGRRCMPLLHPLHWQDVVNLWCGHHLSERRESLPGCSFQAFPNTHVHTAC